MKYFILCPYCNKTYIIDGENQTSFTCPNCGASNKYDDIVSTEDDTEKIRQAAEKIVQEKEERQNKLERLYQREDERKQRMSGQQELEEESSSVGNANSSGSKYAFEESDMPKAFSTLVIVAFVFLIIIYISCSQLPDKKTPASTINTDYIDLFPVQEQQETENMGATEIYTLKDEIAIAIANGDESKLKSYLYGSENYDDIPLSRWQSFFTKTFSLGWEDPTFHYIEFTFSFSLPRSDDTQATSHTEQDPYQVFRVWDSNLYRYSLQFCQNDSGEWFLFLNFFDVVSSSCEEALFEIWSAVKEAALTYADSSSIKKYFTDDITTDQLDDLLRCVRLSLEDHGPYANAQLTKLELFGSMSHEYYDEFSVEVYAHYQSQSSSHPGGRYFSKISLKYSDSEWQICELPDYNFFTIEPVESME